MSSGVPRSRNLLAALILAATGAVLLPWQAGIQRAARREGFHASPLGSGLREQIGQSAFLAALSGFRAPIAAVLWIEAYEAWEKTEWGRMAGLFNAVTTLQPHTLTYWDIASWHMAWNAGIAALQDKKQPSEVLRERTSRQYVELGRDFLERGIRNNPDSFLLQERLGILLRDKLGDHAAAAAAFAKAASLPGAPSYLERFAAYEASKVPGMEAETLRRLRNLYDRGERQPALLANIRELEQKLNVPAAERLPLPPPPVPHP